MRKGEGDHKEDELKVTKVIFEDVDEEELRRLFRRLFELLQLDNPKIGKKKKTKKRKKKRRS